jgi:CheY-like chemotaxis protein/HPt (histidine-containing phosphotransfer) domain-containing protein
MGGEIGVESRPGTGSIFWFTARFEIQPRDRETVTDELPDIAGIKVLVVDDNDNNRLLVTTLLRSWGCRYEEASDATTALTILGQSFRSDDAVRIALLDIIMPDVDGAELARKIKGSQDICGTRLVALSSLGEVADTARLKEIGFVEYLSKPLRQSELRDCLARVMATGPESDQRIEPLVGTGAVVTESIKQGAIVLIAEDNMTNQQVALGILKKLGYRADAVANGREAIEALKRIPYDVVLMDCQMPEMDGFEATRQIRSGESGVLRPDIPVIALTAHAMQADRERCLESGMNDYVTKPIRPAVLSEALQKWLMKARDDTDHGTKPTGGPIPPSSTRESDVLVFDKAEFLERIMGDEELGKVIVEGFLEDIPRQILSLGAFLDQRDVDQAIRQAHTIKGAAANVGGKGVQSVAYEIEKAAKAGDHDRTTGLMPQLKVGFDMLRQAMEAEILASEL